MFQALRGRRAFRCRSCRFRFHRTEAARGTPAPGTKRKASRHHLVKRGRRRIRPWMVEIAIFALLLPIFFTFLRYLTREPAASQEGGQAWFDSCTTHV